MKFLERLFSKPITRHLGRWNLKDNTFKKVDLANIDNCGDRLCTIKSAKVIKSKNIKQ